jgi:putative hemolysin
MNFLWAVILAFIGIAFFAAMETAFTAFDRILLATWQRTRRFGTRAVQFFNARPERFLAATLIGSNVSNVVYSSLLVLLTEAAGWREWWLFTISPLVVLVIGEILPKMAGYALANLFVRWGAIPLAVTNVLFLPLRILLLPITRLVPVKSRANLWSGEPLLARRDIDLILVGAEAEGTVTKEEAEILARYLDARDLKVRQIMTPRTQMAAVSAALSPDEVREVFRKTRYNVLPVYDGDLDHIMGYLRARDFLFESKSLHEMLRPLRAVPESKRIADLLREFKSGRQQMALVVDEYGGTDGFVTLRDIVEELVGPTAERWDPQDAVIKRIAPGRFLVGGHAFLEDVEKATGWKPPAEEANTLSGFLSEHLGRIAELGEDVNFDEVVVRVIGRTPRRVEACLVRILSRSAEEEAQEA